jgi:phage recombination protein Bet
MKQEITTRENNTSIEKAIKPFMEITPADIKRYVCSTASDQEIGHFIRFCLTRKLNPFLKEAYLIKHNGTDKHGRPWPAYIVIDVEKRIEPYFTHPKYRGYSAGLILERKNELIETEGELYFEKDTIVGGWFMGYMEGREPYVNKLSFREWAMRSSKLWEERPARMMYKTTVIHGHRFMLPGWNKSNIPLDDIELTDEVLTITDEEGAETKPKLSIDSDLQTRRVKFFQYMRQIHGLAIAEEIRARVEHVIGEGVSSLNKFIANDNQVLKFYQEDPIKLNPGQDPEKELFGTDMDEKPYEKT